MALDEGGAGSLEQFILLAKNARGRACVALIQQVLSNKKLFVFRELLDMPNVSALENKEYHGYLELLKIFSSGTYKDYVAKKQELPALTPVQEQKLRKLTIVSLCHQSKMVPYSVMMEAIQMSTVRELEDVIIGAIYSGLIQGKLDQKSQTLAVKYVVGRDIQHSDIDSMIRKLKNWKTEAGKVCTTIDNVLSYTEAVQLEEEKRNEQLRAKISAKYASFKGSGNSGFRADEIGYHHHPQDPYVGSRRAYGPGKQRLQGMSKKGRF